MIRSILRRPQYYAILAILFAAILALCANPSGTISLIATKAASSEKLYPVPEGATPISSLTPQDFADLLPPQVLLDWQQYNAQGQQTDAKKKK